MNTHTPRWSLNLPDISELIDPDAPGAGPKAITANFNILDGVVGATISAGAPTGQTDGQLNLRTDTTQLSYHDSAPSDNYFSSYVSGQLDLNFDSSTSPWNGLTTAIPSAGTEAVMSDSTFISHGSMLLRGKLVALGPAFTATSIAMPRIIWRIRYGAGAITTGSTLLYQTASSYRTSGSESGGVDFCVPMPSSTFTIGSTFHIGVTAQVVTGGGVTYSANGSFRGVDSFLRGYIQ